MKAQPKLLSLELGRFIAALLIMLSHEVDFIRIDPQVSGAGFLQPLHIPQPPSVEYFFILSGFVMMTAHGGDFGKPWAALRFFWRRAGRIYPAYWAALIVPIYLWHSITTWHHYLSLITLMPRQAWEYDDVAWTLRYEMAFYIFFGLGLLPGAGRFILGGWMAVVLFFWLPPGLGLQAPHWLAVVVARAAQGKVSQMFFYSLDELFLFGMAAGYVYRRYRLTAWASWGGVVAGLVCLGLDVGVAGFGFSYGGADAFVLGGAGFALLMLGLAGLEARGVLRLGAVCRELGKISYPLYVIHDTAILLTINIMVRHPIKGSGAPAEAFAMMMSLTIIGALMLTYFFDQPVQKFLRRKIFIFRPVHPAL